MWPEKQDVINITPVNPGQERCCDSLLWANGSKR